MRQKLTKTVVEAAQKCDRRIVIWDAGDGAVKGFGLKVEPSGKKIFVFQYRMDGGRRAKVKRFTIGELSAALTAASARGIAEGLEMKVRSGVDPIIEAKAIAEEERRKAEAQAGRAELVADDYLKALKRRKKGLRSFARIQRYFELYITGTKESPGPWWGRLIGEIGARDVRDILRTLVKQGNVGSTRHVLAILRPFFSFAISQELRSDDPTKGVKLKDFGHELESRERYLTPAELRAVWKAAASLDYPHGPFFKLLILTAQRRNDVAGMRRREFAQGETWKIPGARFKNGKEQVVHLSKQALEVLRSIPEAADDWAFTTTGKGPITGFSKAKAQLDTVSGLTADNEAGWWLHDLRRTFSTIAAEVIKVPPHVTDKVLGHLQGTIKGVAKVYQKAEFLEERAAALDAWGLYVETLVADDSADAPKRAGDLARAHYQRTMQGITHAPPALRVVAG